MLRPCLETVLATCGDSGRRLLVTFAGVTVEFGGCCAIPACLSALFLIIKRYKLETGVLGSEVTAL